MRAYILIEASVGRAKAVFDGLTRAKLPGARLISVDVVTGPYDVIAQIETDNLDELGRVISDGIQGVDGVERTTTCLA